MMRMNAMGVCALILVGAFAAAQPTRPTEGDVLGRHVALDPGTRLVYEGKQRFSYTPANGKPLETDSELRVELFVLGRLSDGEVEVARIVRSRRIGRAKELGVTEVGLYALDRDKATLKARGRPVRRSPNVGGRPYPTVPWPLDWRTHDFERAFGENAIPLRASMARVDGQAGRVRIAVALATDEPVVCKTSATAVHVHDATEAHVFEPSTGRIVEHSMRDEFRFDDITQITEQTLRLVSAETLEPAAHAAEAKRVRAVADAIEPMQRDPGESLARLRSLADDGRAPDDRLAFLIAQAERRVEWRRKDKAHEAKVAKLVGKPAPDFTLERLRGGAQFSLREARGQIVLLTFWGVG